MSENFRVISNVENQAEMVNYFIPLMSKMRTENITQYGLTGRKTWDGIDYGEGKTRSGVRLTEWNIWRDDTLKSRWMLKFLDLFTDCDIGRIRIMRLGPRTCFSLHKDLTPRVHVPIVTTPASLMIIENESRYLERGKIWWTNTTKLHTSVNTGESDRYHLLVEVSK